MNASTTRRLVFALAACGGGLSAAPTATAAPPEEATSLRAQATTLHAPAPSDASVPGLRGSLYQEDFETIPLGLIDGISGWVSNSGLVELSGTQTGGIPEPTFGNRSLSVNFAGTETGVARTPVFGSQTGQFGLVEADVIIYPLGGSGTITTAISTIDGVSDFVNTRIVLSTGGVIEALQAVSGSGVFMPTSGSWSFGTPTRIGIETLPNNVLNVYQDGALIFSGHDVSQELGNAGGANAVSFQTFNDNLTGPRPYFDNIEVIEAAPPTGETSRVSVTSAGAQSSGFIFDELAISADGRFVAFEIDSALVAEDTNGRFDIYVHDRDTGETTRASVSSTGDQIVGTNAFQPDISADGRFVTFHTSANNLVPGDTNSAEDIFVRDRLLGETTRVSVSTSGAQSDATSSGASSLPQSAITGDGRFVAFSSSATNLVPGDTNGFRDIFRRDWRTDPCPADLSNNGVVGAEDLSVLLAAWRPNPGHPADFDASGEVEAADLAVLLAGWGPCS